MARYRRCRTLSRDDAAYIAGLIDGEGTIALSRKHRHENRQVVVSISNTDAELLRFVGQAVGAGRITRKRIARTEHAPSVTYTITNRQALDLIEQVVPWLRTYKAQRARMLLDDYLRLTPRNGKYTPILRQQRELFVERFLLLNPRRRAS